MLAPIRMIKDFMGARPACFSLHLRSIASLVTEGSLHIVAGLIVVRDIEAHLFLIRRYPNPGGDNAHQF